MSEVRKQGPPVKRYRKEEKSQSDSDDDDNYVPYVPVKERVKQKLGRLGQLKDSEANNKAKSSSENEFEDEEGEDGQVWGRKFNISLLDQHTELKKLAEAKKVSAVERQLKEEEKILESVAEKKALMGVAELAKGIQYEDPIKTSWRPPRYVLAKPARRHHNIRANMRIMVEGEDIPPPLKTFKEMKFHRGILDGLQQKKITKPTPIQVQGIPTVIEETHFLKVAQDISADFTLCSMRGGARIKTHSLPPATFGDFWLYPPVPPTTYVASCIGSTNSSVVCWY